MYMAKDPSVFAVLMLNVEVADEYRRFVARP